MRMAVAIVLWVVAACRWNFDAVSGSHDAADGPGGDGPPALSCGPLPATCGPTGNASCCESPVVEGGTYYRIYDSAPDMQYPDMSWPATVSTFRLDKYEVTVGRFRQFVEAGMGTQANPPAPGASRRTLNGMPDQGGWDPAWNASLPVDTSALITSVNCEAGYQTWTDTPAGNEHRPMVCINWFEAMAFCAWDGGELPTEAEWMYAASGGFQRAYPWSDPPESLTIDCTLANYGGQNWATTACVAQGPNDVGSTSPQGDGVWGQADLGGNVWEWGLDWYAAALPLPCTDCANLGPGTARGGRGGSFKTPAYSARVGHRYDEDPPTFRYNDVGVRCARRIAN
jgi:sulfatase modifying factor 1